MEMHRHNGTLSVTGLRELNSATARSFRAAVVSEVSPDLQTIEMDLSQMRFIDSTGLAALVSLYNALNGSEGRKTITLRLTNPAPPVQQMIELARLHHLFEVAPSGMKQGDELQH